MQETKKLGVRGEIIAKEYLLANNYEILATNYKNSYQEIDIIARLKRKYIFIEVKTRTRNNESINENPLSSYQTKNLKIAILNYASKNNLNLDLINLDLIFILVDKENNNASLRHYRDIF